MYAKDRQYSIHKYNDRVKHELMQGTYLKTLNGTTKPETRLNKSHTNENKPINYTAPTLTI